MLLEAMIFTCVLIIGVLIALCWIDLGYPDEQENSEFDEHPWY